MDTPRLYIPIIFFLIAALVLGLVLKVQLPDWVRFWLASVAIIFGMAGIITALNWLSYTSANRIRDLADARTHGARVMANAIRDMSSSKAEAILSMNQVYIEMIAEETEPVFLVRTLTGVVPFEFVVDFMEQSATTDPYLYPVRECANKDWGSALTRLIIAKGWAVDSSGPLPAKMTKPIKYIAAKFGVELDA